MTKLVDIFYYDYLITQIIKMLLADKPSNELNLYLALANRFHKNFIDAEVELDQEIYAKTLAVNLIEIAQKNEAICSAKKIDEIMNFLIFLVEEYKLTFKGQLLRFGLIVAGFYLQKDAKENEHIPIKKFIFLTFGTLNIEKLMEKASAPSNLSYSTFIEFMKGIEFGTPVIEIFVDQIKKEIDLLKSKKPETPSDSGKLNINPSSPGEKVNW